MLMFLEVIINQIRLCYRNTKRSSRKWNRPLKLNGLTRVITLIVITFIEQLNEYMYQYEEENLKVYAGSKFENFLVFKHP